MNETFRSTAHITQIVGLDSLDKKGRGRLQTNTDRDHTIFRRIYTKYENESLRHKLNLDRVKSFVEEKTGKKISTDLIIIDPEHKHSALRRLGFNQELEVYGSYMAMKNVVTIFLDKNFDHVFTESVVAHELTHATGTKIGRVKIIGRDPKLRQCRSGFSLSEDYGNFLEEGFANHIEHSYLKAFAGEEYMRRFKIYFEGMSTWRNFDNKVGKMNIGTNGPTVSVPLEYFVLDPNLVPILNGISLLTYIYELMSKKMKMAGFDFDQLIIASRKDLRCIKELAQAINNVFGAGTYTRLQKIPLYHETTRDILLQEILFLQNF